MDLNVKHAQKIHFITFQHLNANIVKEANFIMLILNNVNAQKINFGTVFNVYNVIIQNILILLLNYV